MGWRFSLSQPGLTEIKWDHPRTSGSTEVNQGQMGSMMSIGVNQGYLGQLVQIQATGVNQSQPPQIESMRLTGINWGQLRSTGIN